MFSLNDLVFFVHVVEAGSFSKAARRLGVTKSATSKAVTRLEEALVTRLMERTTRTLSLTEAGEVFYNHCASIMAEVELAQQSIGQLTGEPRGRLRVGVSVDFASRHVVPALGGFYQTYPGIAVDLVCSDQPRDLLAEGYDMAIRIGKLADSFLIARKLADDRAVLVGAPHYFADRDVPQEPSDVVGLDCLAFSHDLGRTDTERWTFRPNDGTDPLEVVVKPCLRANAGPPLLAALLAGVGIGNAPLSIVADHIREGRLIRLLPDYYAAEFGIYALYPPSRHVPPKVLALVDYLQGYFGSPAGWLT